MKQLANDVKVKDALHEIFKDNAALLKDSKSLIAKIEELAPTDYMNLALFRSALLKANIGEFIAARDIKNPDACDKVKYEAIELLKKQNLSEKNSKNIVQQILDAIPQDIAPPPLPPPPPPPPPKTAEDYYNDGVKSLVGEDYAAAMAAFDKAIEMRPTYEDAYNVRGALHSTKKRIQ